MLFGGFLLFAHSLLPLSELKEEVHVKLVALGLREKRERQMGELRSLTSLLQVTNKLKDDLTDPSHKAGTAMMRSFTSAGPDRF